MKKFLIIAAAVVALGLGAVALGGAVTSAQSGDGPLGTFLARVAEKLGISEEKLSTAIRDTQLEIIDEQLAQDNITPEQAARLRERVEEGGILFPPRPGHHLRHAVCHRLGYLIVHAAAQVLDMETPQVIEEVKSGKNLAQVAEAQGMSVEEFTPALLNQVGIDLDELKEQGKLTEEQGTRIFQAIEENIDRIVNGEHGPCRPHRHHDGPRPLEAPETTELSETTA